MGLLAILKEYGSPPGSLEELRDMIAASYRVQYPNPRTDGSYAYICGTFPDEQYVIVASDSPIGEEYSRHDFTVTADGTLAFGAGQPLTIEFVPADVQAEATRARAVRRDGRRVVGEVRAVSEAAFDKSTNTLSITIIREGFNTAKSRYYTEAAVRSGVAVFKGLKMYADHQTQAEEKARPEGSIADWVATLTETAYDRTGHRLRGTAKVVDPQFAEKLALLDEQGLLTTLGISIRAIGAGEDTLVEGARTFQVSEFTAGRSVDFVTEAGAGGYVEWREAAGDDTDVDAISLSRLKERRPDLVQALIHEQAQEGGRMTQQELDAERAARTAAEAKAADAEARAAAAESAVAVVRAEQAQATAQEAIGKLISESKLPEPAQVYLREALKTEGDVETAKATIEAQRQLLAAYTGAGIVRGNGEAVAESGAVDLAKSFARFPGMTEASAALAAKGGR